MVGFQGLGSLRPGTIFLAALSLSIGWGIRGNFGHEYGAMIPGALTAIVLCLLSGRADWRARLPYFAFFGALGWGFGGSMSYMQVVSYTHSGHLASQYYGFFGVFVIGFLWAAMGGAGTAFPAVVDKERLAAVFRPLCWIFVFWVIFKKYILFELETLFPENYDPTWSRQAAHTYWFDADWMETTAAIIALLCFEMWDNRREHFLRFKVLFLALFLAAFGLVGYGVQATLNATGAAPYIGDALLQYQVTPEFIAAAAEERGLVEEAVAAGMGPEEARAQAEAQVRADQLINWPNVVLFYPQHIGWFVGALIGLAVYFFRFGRFGSGASLFMHMCIGWFTCFLIFPVLLGHPVESGPIWFRMTPPRSDNWAGLLGVVIGTGIWLVRNRYVPVLYAMLVTGILGGFGFAGGTLIKLMMVRPGNPNVEADPAVIEQWSHWQHSNWHSFMEQTQGFMHGLAIAIAIGLLATRTGRNDGAPTQRWTAVFAVGFVLFGLTYLNMFKNVLEWTAKAGVMPDPMELPLVRGVELSAAACFNIVFAAAAVAGIVLMIRHTKRPIAMIPQTALGKGQMLYIAFMATVVVMNFERALPSFTSGRLLTEFVIFLNATLAVLLILLLPRPDQDAPECGMIDYSRSLARVAWGGLLAIIVTTLCMTWIVRGLYGDNFIGHAGEQYRFGEEAEWRIDPTEKSSEHS